MHTYLLKERVGDVSTFVDAVTRGAAGGSAPDPEGISRMIGRPACGDPLDRLTGREQAVLVHLRHRR